MVRLHVIEMGQEVVELIGVNEGFAVPLQPELVLVVVQKVAKVDVEEAARVLLEHEVGGVPVAYPDTVRCHALPRQ